MTKIYLTVADRQIGKAISMTFDSEHEMRDNFPALLSKLDTYRTVSSIRYDRLLSRYYVGVI